MHVLVAVCSDFYAACEEYFTSAKRSYVCSSSAASYHGICQVFVFVQTFCRKFCWHSLMLWPEDMPQATTVSLSAYDDLVPADLVKAQLEASPLPANVLVHPTAGHGGYLLDQQYQENLISEVQKLASTQA